MFTSNNNVILENIFTCHRYRYIFLYTLWNWIVYLFGRARDRRGCRMLTVEYTIPEHWQQMTMNVSSQFHRATYCTYVHIARFQIPLGEDCEVCVLCICLD